MEGCLGGCTFTFRLLASVGIWRSVSKESTLQQEGQREPSVVVVVVVCCLVETVVGAAQLAKDYGGLRRPECVQKSPSDQKRKSFVRKAQSGVESISSWSYDMEGHAKKCVERNCELANKTTQQVYKVATPRIDDHQFKEEEMGSLGELSQLCLQIVLKCLYLARIGRSDVFVVSEKACPCHHKMDESMRQTFSTFHFLHPSCK